MIMEHCMSSAVACELPGQTTLYLACVYRSSTVSVLCDFSVYNTEPRWVGLLFDARGSSALSSIRRRSLEAERKYHQWWGNSWTPDRFTVCHASKHGSIVLSVHQTTPHLFNVTVTVLFYFLTHPIATKKDRNPLRKPAQALYLPTVYVSLG